MPLDAPDAITDTQDKVLLYKYPLAMLLQYMHVHLPDHHLQPQMTIWQLVMFRRSFGRCNDGLLLTQCFGWAALTPHESVRRHSATILIAAEHFCHSRYSCMLYPYVIASGKYSSDDSNYIFSLHQL